MFGGTDTDDVNGFLLTHGYQVDHEDVVIRVVGLEPVDTARPQPADAYPLSLGKVVDCVGYAR